MKRNYTKEQVEEAVKNAFNYSQVFRNLSLLVNGGSYTWIKAMIKRYDISTDHFHKGNISLIEAGIAASKERMKEKFNSNDISTNERIAASTLRSYLSHNNIESVCNSCGLTDWMGKPLRLDIDHMDGNPINNKLENLQFICPNCHRAKTIVCNEDGKFRGARSSERKEPKLNFCGCSRQISKYSTRCPKCEFAHRRANIKERFDRDYVIELLTENSMLKASKILGLSDNGLRKYCKRNNIDYKLIRCGEKNPIEIGRQ